MLFKLVAKVFKILQIAKDLSKFLSFLYIKD